MGGKKGVGGWVVIFSLEPSKACYLCFISTAFVFLSVLLAHRLFFYLSPQCAPDHAKPGCGTIHGTQRVLLPGIRLALHQRCWDEGTGPAARGLWDCHDRTTPWSSLLLRRCELDHALCILCVVLLLLFGVDSFMCACMPVLLTRLCLCVVMLKIIMTITNVPFKSSLCIHAFKHDRVHKRTLNQSQSVSV